MSSVKSLEKVLIGKYLDNPTAFTFQFTNIWEDSDGTKQLPYDKQVLFMNAKNLPSITSVLKCRQCIVGDTEIWAYETNITNGLSPWPTIKQLYDINYRGLVETVDEYNLSAFDTIIDIWYVGQREVKKHYIDTVTIECTDKHKINTTVGWVNAGDLTQAHIIIMASGSTGEYYGCDTEYIIKDVYDLTTEKYHSYIANDIHVHNSGFSSACVARIVHNAYFGLAPEYMIMSRTQKQAAKVLRRIRSAFNSMPDFMRPKFLKETEEQLILSNGTVIYSLPANPESARGFTGDVYLDEFGTFGNKESYEIWMAIAPATTKGYRIFMVGTPQGTNNLFYELCTKSLEQFSGVVGVDDSYKIKVHWSEVPHIKKDILNIRSRFTPMMFEQEYELRFIEDSDDLFFTTDFIMKHMVDNRDEDELIRFKVYNPNIYKENGGLRYAEDKVPDEVKHKELFDKYSETYIGWDLAKQQDSSVVTVFGRVKETEQFELIAIEYLDKIDYTIQVKIVSIIAQMCMVKRVGYDNTGLGGAVADIVKYSQIAGIIHPVNFTNKFKVEAYQNIRTMAYNGNLKFPNVKRIVGEFRGLVFDPVSQRIEAMAGADEFGNTYKDDIPSSFIVAMDAIRRKKKASTFSFLGT